MYTLKVLFLFLFIFFSSPNVYSQSDTIPEISVSFDYKVMKPGGYLHIDNLPSNIWVDAYATETFQKRAPVECSFRVSHFDIILKNNKGEVKYQTQVTGQTELTGLLPKLAVNDNLTIKTIQVHRKKSTGEDVFYPLHKEFSFKVR